MKQELIDYIDSIQSEIIQYRRHIHQHPELSFHEYETSQFIFERLVQFGLNPEKISETGVVCVISNKNHSFANGCIALRADMDALPIQENTDLPFASVHPGIMHACGHDVHTSVLLGVAKVLSEFREELCEPVKIIFQPGEEKLPGGASILISEGVLENPTVNKIYGLHVAPELKIGQIGWKKGIYMASCDEIHIQIHGKGGHGALPQNCIDPIVIGATLVLQLQTIISRKSDPRTPSVLTIGHFEALGATNVIPSTAILKGTFRTFDEKWREEAHRWILDYTQRTVEAAGGTVDITIEKGYPFLNNHSETTEEALVKWKNQLPNIKCVPLDIRMTSEDFAYYSQKVPACFFRLGTSNENADTQFSVHHPQFMADENAIPIGIKAFCSLLF